MRRVLVGLMILAFLLPSVLLAQEPAAASAQLQRLEAFGAGPRCEASLPDQGLGAAALMDDYDIVSDLCNGFCIISCVAQGYFGGVCTGLTCRCNGAEPQPQQD